MRPTINSEKHYVQTSLTGIVGGAQLSVVLVDGEVTPGATPDHVRVGAIVKAVYVEMWTVSAEAVVGTVLLTLYKKPSGEANMTTAQAGALHTYSNKRNILYHTQGVFGNNATEGVPWMRQWFKIPKGKQRFGLNEQLILNIFPQGTIDVNVCGFTVYKEYF